MKSVTAISMLCMAILILCLAILTGLLIWKITQEDDCTPVDSYGWDNGQLERSCL